MDFNFPLDISALINFTCKDVPGVAHCDTEEWLTDLCHTCVVCVCWCVCVCVLGDGGWGYNSGICAQAAFLFNTVITIEALGYKSLSLSNNI